MTDRAVDRAPKPEADRYPGPIEPIGASRRAGALSRLGRWWALGLVAGALAAFGAATAAARPRPARPAAAPSTVAPRRAHSGVNLAVLAPGGSTPLAAKSGPDPVPTAPGIVHWRATEHALTVGTLTRAYRMVRPAAVPAGSNRLPVLVVLHGRNMTPVEAQEQLHFEAVTGPAIMVFPAGFGESWNAGACCGEAHATGVDDVGFVTDVVHQVLATQADASGAVYLVGYSNGGRMAYRLACADPTLFRAVAMVEAAPVSACPRPGQVPLLVVGSTNDPLLRVDDQEPPIVLDGFRQPSLSGLTADWAAAQGCVAATEQHPAPTLTLRTSTNGTSFSRVELAVYEGGSHAWPAGTGGAPSAQAVVWRFLTASPSAGLANAG